MSDKPKKLKKGRVSEEDMSTLLQRYSPNTVLTLLQEVAHFDGGLKIDWNELVKNSTTGITNAREYQMLWRHLAYRHSMVETFDDGDQPLDDDSDLEYEVEPFPAVSGEASNEATACVKVMISSGLTSDSSHTNNAMIEAPLTINIPNGQLGKTTSESSKGMNITVPVSVQKQSVPAMSSAEQLDTNLPPRRKRKNWTEAEDMELVSAVRKYGEGNWVNILRSEFVWEGRTASQLSQRWANVRKKIGSLNVASNSGAQITVEQRAAQIALNLALDPPVKNSFMSLGGGTTSHRSFAAKPLQLGSAAKSQITVNKAVKPELSSDPVRAAAVAAGARIATQSDAVSLLRAAQAKNAIHIMPTAASSIKSSTHPAVFPSGLRPALERESDPKRDIVNIGGGLLKSAAKLQVQQHRASLERNEPGVQVKQEKPILPNQETEIQTKEKSGEVVVADGNCMSVENGENERLVNGENEDNLTIMLGGDKLEHVNKMEP